MKIYHANGASFPQEGRELVGSLLPTKVGILGSYLDYRERAPDLPYCDSFFLDSGAFSAYRRGVEIDLEEYSLFVRESLDRIAVYANLDVIGDPVETRRNQRRIEDYDLSPLPCYHYGEPISFLYYYMRKYDYIALGGMVPIATNKVVLDRWLCMCWKEILERKPDLKVHGFGMTSIPLMKRFPWFSVDSRSAHIAARFGTLLTPWGPASINPDMQEQALKWKTPSSETVIRDWLEDYWEGKISYDQAAEGTPHGKLLRFVINVDFFERLDLSGSSFDPDKHYIPPLFE